MALVYRPHISDEISEIVERLSADNKEQTIDAEF